MVGAVHVGVGVALYRTELAEIARAGVVNAVPDRGGRATAFWFLAPAPALWLGGRLLRSAEANDDHAAQRAAGVALTATGLACAAAMPASGFWALTAVGVAALRRGRRVVARG